MRPLLIFLSLGITSLCLATPQRVFIGSMAKGEDSGIYQADFDATTGQLSPPVRVAAVPNAGFLALSPDGRHAFSTASGPGTDGKPTGQVAAWARAADTWKLLGMRPTSGGVCHVSVSPDNQTVLAANYGGGSVASFRFDADTGSLSDGITIARHQGKGPSQPRQDGPHAHAIVPLPGGPFAAVPDLGIDTIVVYRWDPATSALTEASRARTPPGSGPRHLAIRPDGRFVYAVNELDHTVSVFAWSAESGTLTPVETVAGRPEDLPPDGLTSAEIRVRPGGKFLYSSTRDLTGAGRDFLTVFAIAGDGRLRVVQHAPAGVAVPRNFAVSPDGRWLLAGGQESGNIQVHAIDSESGMLRPVGPPVACPAPVCFVFAP